MIDIIINNFIINIILSIIIFLVFPLIYVTLIFYIINKCFLKGDNEDTNKNLIKKLL